MNINENTVIKYATSYSSILMFKTLLILLILIIHTIITTDLADLFLDITMTLTMAIFLTKHPYLRPYGQGDIQFIVTEDNITIFAYLYK